mmetsp:Transcript_56203/g.64154  ORF Transcript_56203/g.64154 Transcript_56203/m.64154 type:complete len:103 (-) Transcript_56203:234-542(-)
MNRGFSRGANYFRRASNAQFNFKQTSYGQSFASTNYPKVGKTMFLSCLRQQNALMSVSTLKITNYPELLISMANSSGYEMIKDEENDDEESPVAPQCSLLRR